MRNIIDHDPKVWLPETALQDGILDNWFATKLVTWATNWFGIERAKRVTLEAVPKSTLSLEAVNLSAGVVGVSRYEDSQSIFIENLFEISPIGNASNLADQIFMTEIIDEALSDFQTMLTSYSEQYGHDSKDGNMALLYRVCVGDELLFYFGAKYHICSEFRRSLCPKNPFSECAAGQFSRATSSETVRLEAEIGTVSLKLDYLKRLTTGDVLEFERSLDENFPLRVNARRCNSVQARYILTKKNSFDQEVPGIIFETAQ